MNFKNKSQSVYVGCGEDRREGFIHCDTRELPGVDIVCPAWDLSKYCHNVKEIYSRHMLEHLTSMEADATLVDWYNALEVGGTVYIVVPNMDFHARQWLEADWTEENLRDTRSDARYSFAGLWGWQRECNPRSEDYNQTYWDVHKSGYNEKRIKFLLERAGFIDVATEIKNNVHLVAKGKKIVNKSERQVAPTIKNIRADHKNRYQFACDYLKKTKSTMVLDLACGIGYGSAMLADSLDAQIVAVDIDSGAIDYANKYYKKDNIAFLCQNALEVEIKSEVDAIVSFETIEHLKLDKQLMDIFYRQLKVGGLFICSTPNQTVMPYDKEKFKYHIKHYTVTEFIFLVESAGFKVKETYMQNDKINGSVELGSTGCFTILVCEK
ncbi:methyltransferase domain-containing protein [Algibacillus agarilyticus]|uniref:methyltransferase domain-containing protein n=1 Tax=Algibacillus agarilyticus TaxID=2234133 RepID=UPI000DD02187|nr:methyltransferase domain-containing protein [Algibacillus agarilyticus]